MKKWIFLLGVVVAMGTGCSQGTKSDKAQSAPDAVNAQVVDNPGADDADIKQQQNNNKEEDQAMPDKQAVPDAFGYMVDTFKTKSGKTVSLHCIKHGSLRLEYDGLEFEVDPVLNLNDKKTDYAAFPDADYILVTHEHFDHLDAEAIKALEKDQTVLITNQSCASKLGKGDVMSNGDVRSLRDDIQIEAVAAYNTTPGHEQFHPKGRDNGFVLTLDGFRIYIAGDTEDIPEMANIRDIDVAFLPCNQPYTMTVKQLVHAAEMLQPKVLFPYHYSDTSMDDVVAAMKDSRIDLRIRDYQ